MAFHRLADEIRAGKPWFAEARGKYCGKTRHCALVARDYLPGFAASAARLIEKPNEAARLGRALRQRAQEMLDPEALDEHERREYAKLLS